MKTPNKAPTPLEEGRDFYFNEQGLMVLTEAYLKRRGYCCESGCTHCPYGFRKQPSEPQKPKKS